mgnify:FL=1
MKKTVLIIFASFIISNCSSTKNIRNSSFSKEESQLVLSANSLVPMRVFKITNKKDSLVLRTKSSYVKANPNVLVLQHLKLVF